MVGRKYEAGGIAKDGAKMVMAVANANVSAGKGRWLAAGGQKGRNEADGGGVQCGASQRVPCNARKQAYSFCKINSPSTCHLPPTGSHNSPPPAAAGAQADAHHRRQLWGWQLRHVRPRLLTRFPLHVAQRQVGGNGQAGGQAGGGKYSATTASNLCMPLPSCSPAFCAIPFRHAVFPSPCLPVRHLLLQDQCDGRGAGGHGAGCGGERQAGARGASLGGGGAG